jgi:hypothetical protein
MIMRFLFCVILATVIIPAHVVAEQNQDQEQKQEQKQEQTYSMPPEVIQRKSASQETIGPYNEPRWAARGKFSSDVEIYVLPPYQFYVDLDYEGLFLRHGKISDNVFTQEFEIGLPHRFQLAYENNFEIIGPHVQETIQTIEGRYALADWGKIPLNPTLFGEWHVGVGKNYAAQLGGDPATNTPAIPDSFELRLLLGQELADRLQWGFNFFHEQEVGGQREWETGFAQAFSYAIMDEYLKVGLEMEFIRDCDAETRSHPTYEFDVGPSFTWKPSLHSRLDIAPLFGTTGDSPAVRVFVVFSYDFGNVEREVEGPVSTQHR